MSIINKGKDKSSGMKLDPELVDRIVYILKQKGVKERTRTGSVKYVLNRYIEFNTEILRDYNGDDSN